MIQVRDRLLFRIFLRVPHVRCPFFVGGVTGGGRVTVGKTRFSGGVGGCDSSCFRVGYNKREKVYFEEWKNGTNSADDFLTVV